MAEFDYLAKTPDGQIQKGRLSARDRQSALGALRSRQLLPVLVRPLGRPGLKMNIKLPFAGRVRSRDLVIFTRQFATMVNAGVPILRALAILRNQSGSAELSQTVEAVIADVEGGSSLSASLARHPDVFSVIYVNMVRAGEAGGILDKVLERLAYQQEKDAALRNKIRAAMTYPAVIFSVTILAFFILMTFIVPKIGAIISSLSGGTSKLPVYTQVLLSLSSLMQSPLFIASVLVGLPLGAYGLRRWIKTPNGRLRWHAFLLKIPAVNTIITKTAIARFARIFASLMGAGVSIVEAIETTAGAIGNAVIERELLACSRAVQAGNPLSSQLQKSRHFPPIVAQMLAVGEETGQTEDVILKVAEFYEDEVDAAVGALSSIIEPVMIVLLGGMVGLIALSVFGPITQISTSVG